MQDCCEIFSLTYSWDQRHDCANYCLTEDISECCYDQCFASTYQIWNSITSSVIYENILMAITRNNSISNDLIEIVNSSLKTCTVEILKVPTKKFEIEKCEMNATMWWMTACILKNNYINCPNVTNNEECKSYVQNVECFGKPEVITTRTTKEKASKMTKEGMTGKTTKMKKTTTKKTKK